MAKITCFAIAALIFFGCIDYDDLVPSFLGPKCCWTVSHPDFDLEEEILCTTKEKPYCIPVKTAQCKAICVDRKGLDAWQEQQGRAINEAIP